MLVLVLCTAKAIKDPTFIIQDSGKKREHSDVGIGPKEASEGSESKTDKWIEKMFYTERTPH